ncbi:MAG: iron-sulfur cluster assembly scaffold protein [Deltaproteobacteria bacterium]|nr:iron-sulfur cluster assembly scaffold protein [Deltaproteobacteria bacterium]
MSENVSDFMEKHSVRYLEMALRTDKREIPDCPDGFGKRTGGCGDTVEMFLQVKDDRIRYVSFDTDGCLDTHACCNTVACLSEGKKVAEAWELTPEAVITYLETLSPGHHHCAELAVGALYQALNNHHQLRRSPWKKAYGVRR